MTDLADVVCLAVDQATDDPRADLEAFLVALEDYIKQSDSHGRGGDAMRLFAALKSLQQSDHPRDDAAAVLDGFNIGLYLAAYNRGEFANAVQRTRLKKTRITRAEKRASRNEKIVTEYHALRREHECLSARRILLEKIKITSMRQLIRILRDHGVEISRNSD